MGNDIIIAVTIIKQNIKSHRRSKIGKISNHLSYLVGASKKYKRK